MQKPPLLQLEEGGGLQKKYIWLWNISQARQAEVSAFRDGAQPTHSQRQNVATISHMNWNEKQNCPETPVTNFLHLKPALLCPPYNTQWTKKTLKTWVASICDLSKLNSALTFHSSHKELSFHQRSAPRQSTSPIQLDVLQTYCNCSGFSTASTILNCNCSWKFNSSLTHGVGQH